MGMEIKIHFRVMHSMGHYTHFYWGLERGTVCSKFTQICMTSEPELRTLINKVVILIYLNGETERETHTHVHR